MSDVHVCRAAIVSKRLVKMACDHCGCDRWHAAFLAEWYGWGGTCLRCGEEWQDDEYLERPFCPGWRRKNIDYAKRLWRRTP